MNMNFNQFVFSRQRRFYGKHCKFNDRNEVLFDLPAKRDNFRHYILKNPIDNFTQLSRQFGVDSMNTENMPSTNHGMYHYEGGWPKDVNFLDEEQTIRYRKKIEREDNWGKQVIELTRPAMSAVLQNNAVNIYQDFFATMDQIDLVSNYAACSINVFHDMEKPQRPVVQLGFSPATSTKILALHSDPQYFPKPMADNFFIWDIDNALKVLVEFRSNHLVNKAAYCPKDENLVAGGLSNGMVAVWDTRLGGYPVNISSLEASHREAATALCWVHSKTNTEFYSGSVDGSILYWDGRSLKDAFFSVLLDPVKTDEQERTRAHGCTVLEFEYTIPVRYMAGSEFGSLFLGNRKGLTPMENLTSNFKVMAGAVHSIERNPFFLKNFLIIGDWCAKIWTEECKDYPIGRFRNFEKPFKCGVWSPSKCSVFVTGGVGGRLHFWDLLIDQTNPVFSLDLKSQINTMAYREEGDIIAVGLENGDFELIRVEDGLQRTGPKDKGLISAMFERELHRCKLLEGRIREIRLKQSQERKRLEEKLATEDVDEEIDLEEGEMESVEGGAEEDLEELIDLDPEFSNAKKLFKEIVNMVSEKRSERIFESDLSVFET